MEPSATQIIFPDHKRGETDVAAAMRATDTEPVLEIALACKGIAMMDRFFSAAANKVAHLAGLPLTFAGCCLVIVVWGFSGPAFHFSDTWQLIINTGTTIVTFLMVFLIQNTQNRFIGIEHLTEAEVEEIREKCEKAARP